MGVHSILSGISRIFIVDALNLIEFHRSSTRLTTGPEAYRRFSCCICASQNPIKLQLVTTSKTPSPKRNLLVRCMKMAPMPRNNPPQHDTLRRSRYSLCEDSRDAVALLKQRNLIYAPYASFLPSRAAELPASFSDLTVLPSFSISVPALISTCSSS